MHHLSFSSIPAICALLAGLSISTSTHHVLAPEATSQLGAEVQRAANLDKEPDTVLLCAMYDDKPTLAECLIFAREDDDSVEVDGCESPSCPPRCAGRLIALDSLTRLHLGGSQIESTFHQRRDIVPATITRTVTTIPPYCFTSLTASVLSQTANVAIPPVFESAASAALASVASAAPRPAQATVTSFANTATTVDVTPAKMAPMASGGVKATGGKNGTVSMTGMPTASTEPVTGGANAAGVDGLVRMWLAIVGGLMIL